MFPSLKQFLQEPEHLLHCLSDLSFLSGRFWYKRGRRYPVCRLSVRVSLGVTPQCQAVPGPVCPGSLLTCQPNQGRIPSFISAGLWAWTRGLGSFLGSAGAASPPASLALLPCSEPLAQQEGPKHACVWRGSCQQGLPQRRAEHRSPGCHRASRLPRSWEPERVGRGHGHKMQMVPC